MCGKGGRSELFVSFLHRSWFFGISSPYMSQNYMINVMHEHRIMHQRSMFLTWCDISGGEYCSDWSWVWARQMIIRGLVIVGLGSSKFRPRMRLTCGAAWNAQCGFHQLTWYHFSLVWSWTISYTMTQVKPPAEVLAPWLLRHLGNWVRVHWTWGVFMYVENRSLKKEKRKKRKPR